MSVGREMDGVAHAERTVVVDQWRHDATVGSAVAAGLTEVDVAGLVGEVGDDQDVVLPRLGIAGNDAVLRRSQVCSHSFHSLGFHQCGVRMRWLTFCANRRAQTSSTTPSVALH